MVRKIFVFRPYFSFPAPNFLINKMFHNVFILCVMY